MITPNNINLNTKRSQSVKTWINPLGATGPLDTRIYHYLELAPLFTAITRLLYYPISYMCVHLSHHHSVHSVIGQIEISSHNLWIERDSLFMWTSLKEQSRSMNIMFAIVLWSTVRLGKIPLLYEGVFMTHQNNEIWRQKYMCFLARDHVTSRNKKAILTSIKRPTWPIKPNKRSCVQTFSHIWEQEAKINISNYRLPKDLVI